MSVLQGVGRALQQLLPKEVPLNLRLPDNYVKVGGMGRRIMCLLWARQHPFLRSQQGQHLLVLVAVVLGGTCYPHTAPHLSPLCPATGLLHSADRAAALGADAPRVLSAAGWSTLCISKGATLRLRQAAAGSCWCCAAGAQAQHSVVKRRCSVSQLPWSATFVHPQVLALTACIAESSQMRKRDKAALLAQIEVRVVAVCIIQRGPRCSALEC